MSHEQLTPIMTGQGRGESSQSHDGRTDVLVASFKEAQRALAGLNITGPAPESITELEKMNGFITYPLADGQRAVVMRTGVLEDTQFTIRVMSAAEVDQLHDDQQVLTTAQRDTLQRLQQRGTALGNKALLQIESLTIGESCMFYLDGGEQPLRVERAAPTVYRIWQGDEQQ